MHQQDEEAAFDIPPCCRCRRAIQEETSTRMQIVPMDQALKPGAKGGLANRQKVSCASFSREPCASHLLPLPADCSAVYLRPLR